MRRDAGAVSQPPDKRNPWAKYQQGSVRLPPAAVAPVAKPLELPEPELTATTPAPVAPTAADPGLTRPPMPLDVTRRPKPAPAKGDPALTRAPFARLTSASPQASASAPKRTKPNRPAAPAPGVDAADALAELPPGSTGNPFVSAELKEAAERARRSDVRRAMVKAAGGVLLGLIVLHVLLTRVIWRVPDPESLSRHVTQAMEAVLPLVSTERQPLRLGQVRAVLAEQADAHHLRYIAEITLRLSQPLYVPAHTNGTSQYRLHQESLQSARADELRLRLFPEGEGPPVPEMPLLIQVSHREEEPVVVRVPFTAERTAWTWRLQPPRLDLRSVDRTLAGEILAHYAGSPHLVFGNENLDEVQARTQAAKAYIVRVQQAIQRVASAGAVAEPATPQSDPPNSPAKDAKEAAEKPASEPAAAPPKGP